MSSSNQTHIPNVSIYITTYNYGAYIQESVESVLKQNYGDWELIIVDDGSTDNTRAVLSQFRKHPKIKIFHQKNCNWERIGVSIKIKQLDLKTLLRISPRMDRKKQTSNRCSCI